MTGTPRSSHDVVRTMFTRDAAYLGLWAAQLLGAAALTPIISRLLAPDAFGSVAAVNAVMQVLFVVTGIGLSNALQRTFAQGDGGVADALRLVTLLIVVAGALTALADASGRWWGPALGFDGYPDALRLAVLWGGVSAATAGCLALLRSQDRLMAFAVVSLLQSVVAEALSVTLVAAGSATAARFVLGQLLAQLAALVVGLVLVRPLPVSLRNRRMVRAALAFGLPLVPATLAAFVLNAADRLVVQHQLGEVQVARYQIAYNVGAMPMLLLGVLNSSWLPRLFGVQDLATRKEVLAASRDLLYGILAPVMLGLSLGAPLVLRLWAPSAYRTDALAVVTAVVIISAVPYTAGLAVSRLLLTDGRSTSVAVATVLAAIANIVLNLLLVPVAGLTGSALATLVAYAGLHLLLLRSVPRRLRVASPSRSLLVELGVCSAAALVIAEVAPINTPGLVLRSVGAVICLVWFGRRVILARGRRGSEAGA